MTIGIPKEIKNNENRVAATPAGIAALTAAGHMVKVEKNAGLGSGFTDIAYKVAGAVIVDTADEAWACEMVMKVKEPIESEFKYFREGLILFTYLHLAAEPKLTTSLMKNKVTAIAYETIQLPNGTLPLLTPMSEVAGRMAVQVGASFLEKPNGGKGVLLSGVPGVRRGKVTIIGGGVAGTNAAKVAAGMGAEVTILDNNLERLRQLDDIFGSQIATLASNTLTIAEAVKNSDLVIGAVLIPGAKSPKLVTEAMILTMEPGSVIVDVAIDQGGIFETADHVTTHDDPVYIKHNILHYSVGNMPGAVPNTSTVALTNATLFYALQIANKGYVKAFKESVPLLKGLNTYKGLLTCKAVADACQLPFTEAKFDGQFSVA
ncbi:MAG: alanine dehydrogenase [Mucilaginibacter sp.]